MGVKEIEDIELVKQLINLTDATNTKSYLIIFSSPTCYIFSCSRREGDYAMVVGRVRLDGPTPELQCYACRKVTNFNDITHHHICAIAAYIDLVLKPVRPYFP